MKYGMKEINNIHRILKVKKYFREKKIIPNTDRLFQICLDNEDRKNTQKVL